MRGGGWGVLRLEGERVWRGEGGEERVQSELV